MAAFTSGEAKEPMIDGNVKRVLARIDGIPGRVGEKAFERALAAAARRKLPGSECIAAYTQGLMDLGSLVCRRKSPNCAACPVHHFAKHSRWGAPKTIRGRKQPSLKRTLAGSSLRCDVRRLLVCPCARTNLEGALCTDRGGMQRESVEHVSYC